MKRLFVVLLLIVLSCCLTALPVMAEPPYPYPPPPGTVPELTVVLARLAAGIGVGFVISFLFERFKWFQNLTGEAKWWVIFGLSLGLPVLAQVLLTFVPPEFWAQIEPFWQALGQGFLGWAGSQLVHLGHKAVAAYLSDFIK